MSFNQEKLVQASAQTQGVFNLYSYEPANGDTLADIAATGYFEQSRFIGADGWIGGLINVVAADGYNLFQVDTTGITAAALASASVSADISVLIDNVRSLSIIDMDNDDYTMTHTEALSGTYLILNAGAGGKILLNPTTADTETPRLQSFIVAFAGGNTFFYASETAGAPTEIINDQNDLIIYTPGGSPVSIFNSFVSQNDSFSTWPDKVQAPSKNAVYNIVGTLYTVFSQKGVTNVQSGTTYTLAAVDKWGLVACTNAAAVTVTIPKMTTLDLGDNVQISVMALGAAGVTVVGAAGVTLNGSGSLATNVGKTIRKDGATDTWYIY